MSAIDMNISWGALQNLYYVIPLVLLCIGALIFRIVRAHKAMRVLTSEQWNKKFLLRFSPTKKIIKALLLSLGIIFLSIALLRPQWNKKEETVAQEGRDLFIALDVSRSMLAKDCLPSRLTCAKEKIKELVRRLSAERVGLVLFSGSAFIQCPLTSDYKAFLMFLDQVDVETISSGTTAFDQAIKKVLEAFAPAQERKNKLVVLFTDGEDFSSNLSHVKKQVQQEGLHIFTFGVGTSSGAPIPIFDEYGNQKGHQLDKKGAIVISRLNEGILHTLAHDSGGSYIAMTKDDADLKKLVHQVQQFEKEKIEDKHFSKLEEQYPYFLLISFICIALEWLL